MPPRQSPSQPVAHERRRHAFTPPFCESCASAKTEVATRTDYVLYIYPVLGVRARLERAQARTGLLGQLGRPQGDCLSIGAPFVRRRLRGNPLAVTASAQGTRLSARGSVAAAPPTAHATMIGRLASTPVLRRLADARP